MKIFFHLSLLVLYTTQNIYPNIQQQPEKSLAIIAKNKAIEQEIADFDNFIHENINQVADNTRIVRVTIMIYKDHQEHNKQDWKTLIQRTARSCSRVRSYELQDQDSINLQAEIEAIVKEVANPSNNNGIITEFAIETSDGTPTRGCCGDNCMCIERYRGNCPCSLNNASNRCLFPQEELAFDESYDDDNDDSNSNNEDDTIEESTSEDSSDDTFNDIDLNKKRCCA